MTASSVEVLPACSPPFPRRAVAGFAAVAVLFFTLGSLLYGQNSAAVRGRVLGFDPASATPVTVTARNVRTDSRQSVRAGAGGEFEIPGLAPGSYEIEATQDGNAVSLQRELGAGEQAVIELALPQAAAVQNPASQTTERASGNSPPAAGSQQIDESQLAGLPLNGRSYSQLATLQAGVTDTAGASASRGIGGGSLTIAGGRSTSNNFLLDGTNIMDANNQVPRSAAGVQLG
ncbi:MAG: carboxypeptidase-like regulatory domain-containing protein, partial [Terriglobia bacterium]